MNKELQSLLYRSFDTTLSAGDQKKLDDALASDKELLEEQLQLQNMRDIVSRQSEEKFKPFFSAKVMRKIKAQTGQGEDFIISLLNVFRMTAIAATATVVILLAHNSYVRKDFSLDAALSMPQTNIEEIWELELPGELLQ